MRASRGGVTDREKRTRVGSRCAKEYSSRLPRAPGRVSLTPGIEAHRHGLDRTGARRTGEGERVLLSFAPSGLVLLVSLEPLRGPTCKTLPGPTCKMQTHFSNASRRNPLQTGRLASP